MDQGMRHEAAAAPKGRSRRLAGDMLLSLAFAWLALVLCAALTAHLIAPFDYRATSLEARLLPPVGMGGEWPYLLGTDHLGRDILSRLLHSIQISMAVALAGSLIGAAFGITLGFLAAHLRGVVDSVCMALVDLQAAMPFMVVALGVLALFGNNVLLFIVVIGLHGWERYARLTRSLVLAELEQGYVTALRGFRAPPLLIYRRHILPNIAAALIVNFTLSFPEIILLESGLSFLGMGIQPPLTSLGNMLGFGRDYVADAWWLPVVPGVVIFVTTLAMSLAGDALRDRLDSRLNL
ncbi:ABC transporter permease [Falsiroseomonas sp.]|uniref:ABC transporter permease n=1 Tax=Falsiroseomonas sp. TaxID=2870721 RepID=UPI0034A4C546